ERAARLRSSSWTASFLYWAARARRELGQPDKARRLLEETVQRYKYSYHGLRARDLLATFPPPAAPPPPSLRATVSPAPQIDEPTSPAVRKLPLTARPEEALPGLQGGRPTPLGRPPQARIEGRRGRLRPAINAMKRAYPEYLSAAGDALAEDVWRILYP